MRKPLLFTFLAILLLAQELPHGPSNLTIKTLRDIVETGLGGSLKVEMVF